MIQKRVWHERLPTSPDFDELSKDWTECTIKNWHDTKRGNLTKSSTRSEVLTQTCTARTSSKATPPSKEEAEASAATTDHKVERPSVHCRLRCFSAHGGRKFFFNTQATKTSGKQETTAKNKKGMASSGPPMRRRLACRSSGPACT